MISSKLFISLCSEKLGEIDTILNLKNVNSIIIKDNENVTVVTENQNFNTKIKSIKKFKKILNEGFLNIGEDYSDHYIISKTNILIENEKKELEILIQKDMILNITKKESGILRVTLNNNKKIDILDNILSISEQF